MGLTAKQKMDGKRQIILACALLFLCAVLIPLVGFLVAARDNAHFSFRLEGENDYSTQIIIEDGFLNVVSGNNEETFSLIDIDQSDEGVEFSFEPLNDSYNEEQLNKIIARKMILPNNKHWDSVVGMWEDRVLYERFAGNRVVKITSVSFFEDGTGLIQMGWGEEQSFNAGENDFVFYLERDLRWEQKSPGVFYISDDDLVNGFTLSILT